MSRKTILIAHPYVYPVGGGNAVAAWAIQALARDYDVTLAMLGPVDIAAVNRAFGTALSPDDFQVRIAGRGYQNALRWKVTQGALLEWNLIVRWARELDRGNRFDVLLATQNEADFGRPGLQYIHYPGYYLPRPAMELRWFHYLPGLLRLYRRVCFGISGATLEGIRQNISLANSAFVAGRTREIIGCEPIVLYPPVPGSFPNVPWETRRLAVAAVGRLSAFKRWGMAVEIVEAVRQRGHDLHLTLIGHEYDAEEGRRLRALAASRPWFRILTDLTREELAAEIARHRYGIHTMEEEHFGIGVAEMQRAGCIPFVHNSGGPPEIVGNDSRLIFDNVGDAAEKIARAIEDRATEAELLRAVASRHDAFSAERFCESLRNVVAEFIAKRRAS